MTPTGEQVRQVRVVCTECHFTEAVERIEQRPAEVIVEHGRETGHTLEIENPAAGE